MEELTMKEKKKITVVLAKRYRKARKKEKSKMLDEFVKITGYNRNYASLKLSKYGKPLIVKTRMGRVIMKEDLRQRKKQEKEQSQEHYLKIEFQ